MFASKQRVGIVIKSDDPHCYYEGEFIEFHSLGFIVVSKDGLECWFNLREVVLIKGLKDATVPA